MKFTTTAIIAAIAATAFGSAVLAQEKPPEGPLGGLTRLDRDKDNKISPDEWVADRPTLFKKIDANGDKALTKDEATKFYLAIAPIEDPKTQKRIDAILNADANADGKVTLEELTAYGLADFKKRDKNADGFITAEDLVK